MVFIYTTFFYLSLYFLSYLVNINSFLLNFTSVYYSNFLILSWFLIIIAVLFFYKSNSSWITDIVLYVFGIYRLVNLNLFSSLYLIVNNFKLFLSFLSYNFKNITILIDSQIWIPLFRRGGYLSLLNSSRTRWQLSKSNSIFKNK